MKALVTGSNGQLGSYLCENLLENGYKVYGMVRRSSSCRWDNLNICLKNKNFNLVEGDITDSGNMIKLVKDIQPTHVFNTAAQSHVYTSFSEPKHTYETIYGGTINLLEAIRYNSPFTRFLTLSTSEMFGDSVDKDGYQRETTKFNPRSPYAVAKLAAHHLVDIYRKSYNIFGCCMIMFNAESPRRSLNFLTRKVTKYVAELYYKPNHGITNIPKLKLGNLDSYRDWGYCKEYADFARLILEYDECDDFVVCTGETYSVKEFVIEAFNRINLNWEDWVEIDSSLYRPCEVPMLRGDCSKLEKTFGVKPKTKFKELISIMVESDSLDCYERF